MPYIDTKTKEANLDKWFDGLISTVITTIRTHQLQIETDTARTEIAGLYENMMSNNVDAMAKQNRQTAMMHFVPKLIQDYVHILINEFKIIPQKLALDFDGSSVLVWAQTKDDDEVTEKALILSEAKVNAKYEEFGFHLTTTIVEESDCLAIPNHYKTIE